MAGLFAILGGGPMPPAEVEGIKVKGNPHGIRQGWFGWPFNFDPVWLEECNGFEAAQQSVQADGACTCGELTIFDVEPCPVCGKGE